MTRKIRVLIADDHALLRIGLTSMLSTLPDMEVVGEATNGERAVAAANRLSPDVIVMDLMMPGIGGAEATRRILEIKPKTRIIILTSFGNSPALREALANGAVGAQSKESPTRDLAKAIRRVFAGGNAIDQSITDFSGVEPPVRLTDRQSNVLESVVRGLSNRDIATQLTMSENAVKKHLRHIFAKIGAANRAEAVAIALRKHLLKI